MILNIEMLELQLFHSKKRPENKTRRLKNATCRIQIPGWSAIEDSSGQPPRPRAHLGLDGWTVERDHWYSKNDGVYMMVYGV